MDYIAKYGQRQIIFFAILMFFALLFDVFVLFFAFLFIFSIFVFRDFKPDIQTKDLNAIYSPITGKILDIGMATLDGDKYIKIVIQKSTFSSGVIRSVCDANIVGFTYRNGLFLCNFIKSCEFLNSKATYFFTNGSLKFAMKIIAGPLSKKLYTEDKSSVKALDELGFFTSGMVVLFIPKDSKVYVSVAERVKQATILANFKKD